MATKQQSQPWRPWSTPVHLTFVRHKLCGLLNKLSKANFGPVSREVCQLAISVEKAGDPEVLDAFVRGIFHHSTTNSVHTRLYADLCQRVVDELEAERSMWRKVDLFHLGNPMDCFETCLRLRAQYEFDRIMEEGELDTLYIFAAFIGELLAEGLVFPDDVVSMVDFLFNQAIQNHEGHTTALYRLLSRVADAFNASRLLASLDVLDRVEAVLALAELSLKVRYTMMNVMDDILYPRPPDAFPSHQREEAHGSDSDIESSSGYLTGSQELTVSSTSILQACQHQARVFLLTRQVAAALQFLRGLRPDQRQIFASSLISAALSSGDFYDAQVVGSFFSHPETRGLFDVSTLSHGFEPELSSLEDTVIDIPQAVRLLAVMLQASPLSPSAVETLATTARGQEGDDVVDRLLETYLAMVQSPGSRSGYSSSAASTENLRWIESDSDAVPLGVAY